MSVDSATTPTTRPRATVGVRTLDARPRRTPTPAAKEPAPAAKEMVSCV
ncbi:hypothetical protein PTW37_05155 [Arthrobacter agilis]|nr:hypothetical protein [Arthrobacter agilis]WDF34310.1 hypothetical protein PTW37_05155 [Arthrobacter agilis]